MKLSTLQKTLLIIIMTLILIGPQYSFAISPNQITGNSTIELDTSFSDTVDTITNFISKIGIFIAVGVMMILGIKYMTGSLEERATYKKSMIPYIIGCFLLFGASTLAPRIVETFSDLGKNEDEIGNSILSLIQVVGTLISVGVLMVLGIKYMAGSVEERATYKKTMLPYVIGTVLLFSTVNLTKVIYKTSTELLDGAKSAHAYYMNATAGYSGKTEEEKAQIKEEIQEKIKEAENNLKSLKEDSEEAEYWRNYRDMLIDESRWL